MTIFAKVAEQSIPDKWVVNLTIEVLSMKNTEHCLMVILILSFSVLKVTFVWKIESNLNLKEWDVKKKNSELRLSTCSEY